VVGFMLGEVRSGEFGLEEPTGWIGVLGVDPAARGKAVGRQLAAGIFAHFRARGVRAVRTMVEAGRPELESFFSALGFAPATLKPLLKLL
jgi:GNAT superfamily N-acetyltransferase